MTNSHRAQLKLEIEKEEQNLDKLITAVPMILIILMLMWSKFVYDFSFSLQRPMPEYPESIRILRLSGYGHHYFTRQTILEALYCLSLLYTLNPHVKKGDAPSIRDYGLTLRKAPFLLLAAVMAAVICLTPVLQIFDPTAAWAYRIGLLSGELLFTVLAYIVIRIAFKRKIRHTRADAKIPGAIVFVLIFAYFAFCVLIHNILIPS